MKQVTKKQLLMCVEESLFDLCKLLKHKESCTQEAIDLFRGQCIAYSQLLRQNYNYDLLFDFDTFLAEIYRTLVDF